MPKPMTVLAFDYGTRRIGLAVGNSITALGQALPVITAKKDGSHFTQIAARIAEWAPDHLVVGLPCHPDGAEHAMTVKARRFGQQLQGRFAMETVDSEDDIVAVSSQKAGSQKAAAQKICL